uniref:P53 DNA-binding domain-containing protein n=1 Tax=Setaria digitata TaxID=48799 RepID=A0A915Q4G7_9BILA
MEDEGQRAATTIESLSIARDTSEHLYGTPSLVGLQHPTNDGLWDNITYNASTEDAFIDMSDDVLTLNIPPVDFERTTSEDFGHVLLSQLDNRNVGLSGDYGVNLSSEINVDPPERASLPVSRPEATAHQLGFEVTVEGGRQSAYIFRNRSLFTKMNTSVIFTVNCSNSPPPKSFIRICAIYSDNIYANVPVQRCDYHRSRDRNQEEHFLIVINNSKAQHLTEKVEDEEGFRSFAIVPFDALPPNKCLTLQFRCYSSCVGGINRRQVVLCFSLENGGYLLGDSKMYLKVCSLPSRDANVDAASLPRGRRPTTKNCPTIAEVVSVSTRNTLQQAWDDDDTIYSLEIRGRHLYKIICAIVGNFELTRSLLKARSRRDDKDRLMMSDSSGSGSLSQNTPIDSWLNSLDLLKYSQLFADQSLYVIADLDGIINKMFLLSLGVSAEDTVKMLNSYLAWFNVFNAQRLSSLSSDGSTIRVQRTRVSGSFQAPQSK